MKRDIRIVYTVADHLWTELVSTDNGRTFVDSDGDAVTPDRALREAIAEAEAPGTGLDTR
jgi:hypothetical protein